MIFGLTTWWVAAIATPFLELHVTWRSLAIGGIAGLATSWLTIGGVRRPAHAAERLLAVNASTYARRRAGVANSGLSSAFYLLSL